MRLGRACLSVLRWLRGGGIRGGGIRGGGIRGGPWCPGAWRALCCGLLLGPASYGDFSVTVQPGIDQNRNFDREGYWSRQWVRSVPPQNLPHLVVVHGPQAWLEGTSQPVPVAEVAALNEPHVEVLCAALEEQGLVSNDRLTLAGRVVSMLRLVEVEGTPPTARYRRVWPLWEVLAFAVHADTLSASVASVQTLARLGVEARLARYPSASMAQLYGVLVPDAGGADGSWAYPLAAAALVPVAYSAPPAAGLEPQDVVSWSWSEVLAAGWTPDSGTPAAEAPGNGRTDGGDPIAESASAAGDLPDLCSQALVLGFECVSADPRQARQTTLTAVSGAVIALLAGWLLVVYRQRRQRLRRVELRREEARKGRF